MGGVEFHLGWQTGLRKNGHDPVHVRGRQAGQFTGNLGRRHLADADGFAVQIFAVLRNRFQTVSDSVAEVEDRTQTGLVFILRHHLGLDLTTSGNHRAERGRILRQQLGQIALQPAEQFGIINNAVLDHLRQTGAELARR